MTIKERWITRKEKYGFSGCRNPEEKKLNIRKALKGKSWQNVSKMIFYNKENGVWNKGKKIPQMSGENHWNYGNKMSNKHKEKLFNGQKKYLENGNYWKGKKHTEEHIKNQSESHLKYYKEHPEAIEEMRKRRAKQILPVKDTSIEIKIQNFLKKLGIEFFTHQYMKEIDHGYQCDILIPSMNLVIECDGDYWHKYPIGREIDHIRTKELIQKGFKVLRLWEFEIKAMSLNQFKNNLKKK